MRPFIFLFTRTFFNGIRRSLTSPKRAISLIFFGVYYYFLIIRSLVPTTNIPAPPIAHRISMPDPAILHGWLFCIFSLASLFMAGSVFSARGGFRPADVDVLFATPVSPRFVLMFRMIRDYLFTLLAPLLLGLLGWRGTSLGVSALFRNYPTHSMDVLRATWIAWSLMSLAFVSISTGVSLFVGRSDTRSDANQKIITYTINAILVATLAYVGFRLHQSLSWATALDLSKSTGLQVVFLPATLASDFVMGSLDGSLFLVVTASVGLISTIALGIALALTQVGWLYDQGAAKGFGSSSTMKLRRSGDYYGIAAERARSGKKSRNVLSKRISRLTYRNSVALIWKELLLQLRGPMSGALITFCGILFGYGCIGWVLSNNQDSQIPLGGFEVLVPCATAYMLGAINGFGGFREMLRKVDFLKPLPFSSGRIVLFEVLAKAPIPVFMLAGGAIELSVLRPSDATNVLAGFILGSCLLLEITGAILLAVVLFPDFEDPTQRGLSGLIMMLAIAICSSPGIGLFILLTELFAWPNILAAIPSGTILIAVTVALSFVSGNIYSGYNPSE